jgi:hypothetical protein
LPDQFCKIFILACLVLFQNKAYAEAGPPPGIIESLERLLEVHKKQFETNKAKAQSNLKSLENLESLKEVAIDPQFLRSIIIHSDDKYLRLVQNDECKFYSALENNLLKTADGEADSILITFKNKDNTSGSASVPKNDFFDYIYKSRCINNRDYATLFTDQNFPKTLEGIKFSIPKNSTECQTIHKEWIENTFTPYLCRIQQLMKKPKTNKQAELYKSKIPLLQKTYIDNLCNNLLAPDRFCENYLKNDIWNKVISAESPGYKLTYKCKNILGKPDLTAADLKTCAAKFNAEPSICETRGVRDFPSDFPLQNCNLISDALNHSKLKTDYQDCPGNVDNEALTNVHRIVNHFDPRTIVTSKETCSGEASYSFARLNFDIKHEEGWPLKICYMNNVIRKEECLSYIPGSRENEPMSEDQVIARIIYKHKGAPPKTKCRIVDSKTYNPLRSEFKFGCFIVYDAETCTTLSCTKKVIWDEKTLEDIKFIGKPVFEYFPTAFMNERYSFDSMINEVKRTQSRSIKNLTDLEFYLDKIPNSIIHGVGCVEDLLPEEFQRTVINQCHPMPFIIDGYLVKNKITWIVLRSAIDDLHSPRLVMWNEVFNSVSAHRELHPLNTWTLYGIKK